MPEPLIPDLLDLFPDTVTVEEPTGFDQYGKPLGYGTARELPARIAGRIVKVTSTDGTERVSSMQILLGGEFGVTPKARITLPARYTPRYPKVLAIRYSTDENGPHHERIFCA